MTSHSIVEVTDAIKANLDAHTFDPALDHNYYGDPKLVPRFPATIVEPAAKARGLSGPASTHRWAIDFAVSVTVLYAKLEDPEVSHHALDQLVEDIEDFLNATPLNLGGLVVGGFVTTVNYGGIRRTPSAFYRATRVLWEAQSRQNF